MDPADELAQRIDRFPTIPDVALEIARELGHDEFELDQVAELIARDPVLAARVVVLARSPIFGCARANESLPQAILRLGAKETQNAVLSVAVLDTLPEIPDPPGLTSFWTMGLATALSARHLAAAIGYRHPERAYLAGLVHMMGDAFLAIEYTDRYRRAGNLAGERQEPLASALEREFEIAIPAVTARVLRHWRLAEDVVEAVEYHLDAGSAPRDALLADVVFTADRICRALRLAPPDPGCPDRAWAAEIPSERIARLLTPAHPDIGHYLAEQREFLEFVEDSVRATFATKRVS